MPERELPEDGELRLGGVVSSGRRAYTEGLFGEGRVVAWVTDGRVPDPSRYPTTKICAGLFGVQW